MNDLFSDFLTSHRQAILIPGFGLLIYLFFHFFNHALVFRGIFKRLIPNLKDSSIQKLSEKLGGFLWLGMVPVLFVGLLIPGFSFRWFLPDDFTKTLSWFIAIIPIPIVTAWFSGRSAVHQQQYPQVRETFWSRKLLITDLICWALYLLGYEAFFRGYLLYGMLMVATPWEAIAMNVVFYALVHIPKGKGEAFGAVPLGIVLCIATLQTGSFWVAFLVHLVMAWSNELFTLRMHPGITSPLSRRR
ncbi:MAG TPA: CPBP family intramembrane metalloprotease [Bacteroidales bacterium]|nr:CPBP family intramembrane metalloprotease [Bacteroidales bacterium]HRZ50081.1 CPBP family intramembrane metalloprotease [Bacteroidales bacterium]